MVREDEMRWSNEMVDGDGDMVEDEREMRWLGAWERKE